MGKSIDKKIMAVLFLPLAFFSFNEKSYACDIDNLKHKIDQIKTKIVCNIDVDIKTCKSILSPTSVALDDIHYNTDLFINSCHRDNFYLLSPIPIAVRNLITSFENSTHHYVTSVEDFYRHTSLHRKRVKALGMELLRQNPEVFSGVRPEQLRIALDAHDMGKISPNAKYVDGRPFYKVLFQEGYGKQINRDVVNQLNNHDQRYMQEAFKKAGLAKSPDHTSAHRARVQDIRHKIARIEKIADLVDRGMSPVAQEEFGRPMQRAGVFLDNPQDRQLARSLETNYQNIIDGLEYKRPDAIEKKSIRAQMILNERFSSSLQSHGPHGLSVRAVANRAWTSSKKGFSGFLKALSSKNAIRGFLALDALALYFGDMDSMSCTMTPGYHDWHKDPYCKPVKDITPKIIEFLNEPWEYQKHLALTQDHTCKVIESIYEEIKTPLNIIDCQKNSRVFEVYENQQIKIDHINSGTRNIKFKNFNKTVFNASLGKFKSASLNNDGDIQKACFNQNQGRGLRYTKCYKKDHLSIFPNTLEQIKEKITSFNYKTTQAFQSECEISQ